MIIRPSARPAAWVAALRAGRPDAYGRPAETGASDGSGLTCRRRADIPAGRAMSNGRHMVRVSRC